METRKNAAPTESWEEIDWKSLQGLDLGPGDLSYRSQSGKNFRLLQAGDPLTAEFIKKYRAKGIEKIFLKRVQGAE